MRTASARSRSRRSTAGKVTRSRDGDADDQRATITVSTDGVAAELGDAVKTFVDANIQITPATATNPIGTNHVLTVTVNAVGGLLDAGQHTATASIVSGPGSFVGSPTCTYTGGAATATLHGDDHVRRDRHDGGVGDGGHPGQRRDDHARRREPPRTRRPAARQRVEDVGGREHPDHAAVGEQPGGDEPRADGARERGRRRARCWSAARRRRRS